MHGTRFLFHKKSGYSGFCFSHGIHIHIRAHFAHRYTNAHTTHTGILTCTMGGVSGWELAGFLELLLPPSSPTGSRTDRGEAGHNTYEL